MPVDSIYKRTLPFQKRGPLIAVEGLDGSGKSELVRALRARLEAAGQQVIASNWNDTTEIYNLMMRLNAAGRLDNDTRCLLGAVELAARYHYIVRPALDAGTTVLLSKYLLSAVAHSRVRGHSMAFVRPLYDFAHEPDVTLYVDIPVEVALARKRRAGRIGFWEAGLDLALDLPLADALRLYGDRGLDDAFVDRRFLRFQGQLAELHRELLRGSSVVFLDGTLPADELVERAVSAVGPIVADAITSACRPSPDGRQEVRT